MMTDGPYRPSNGTEGEGFIARWCAGCARDVRQDCTILARSLAFDIDHPNYPKEWTVQAGAGPRCTSFMPLGVLSDRARKAWATRRAKRDAAFTGHLFEQ